MIQQANLSRLSDPNSTAVSVDPFIQIGYVRDFLGLYMLFTE